MKRTQNTLNKMAKALNKSPKAMAIMEELKNKAILNGYTIEQWNKAKADILEQLFFMLCQKDPTIKNNLCMDLYETIREAK